MVEGKHDEHAGSDRADAFVSMSLNCQCLASVQRNTRRVLCLVSGSVEGMGLIWCQCGCGA
ncbi:hypothetical protein CT0861_03092 [Colletotrichum tofieldiae]|uniref:Uncharacterized protein n=1 Tax=Colletotrichum tofieldiae TaxID=708197 RepID=A0A166Y6I4_9PEZI|nr:hypothetical protein CT0861_03092 [Colletotrichum tofieldiae]